MRWGGSPWEGMDSGDIETLYLYIMFSLSLLSPSYVRSFLSRSLCRTGGEVASVCLHFILLYSCTVSATASHL